MNLSTAGATQRLSERAAIMVKDRFLAAIRSKNPKAAVTTQKI